MKNSFIKNFAVFALLIAILTFGILNHIAIKNIDCCNDEIVKVENNLKTLINKEPVDTSGLVAIQFLVLNNNCIEIDTTILVDCNDICEGEVIEENNTAIVVVDTDSSDKVKTFFEEESGKETTEEVTEVVDVLIDTVLEKDSTEQTSTCPEIFNFTFTTDRISDVDTITLYADTSSIILGMNGFEKKSLQNFYTYNDEHGLKTDLLYQTAFDGSFASYQLTEKKEGLDSVVVFTESFELNEANNYSLKQFNTSYQHQHLESMPNYYKTGNAGKALLIAGPTKLGLVYVSERILRKRPDIVYQDYNNLGLHKANDPWSLINKNNYTSKQLENITRIIDNNSTESKREKEYVTWQRINDVVFVASLLETAAGVTLLAIDGKEKKNQFVVTPVGINYTRTIKSK